MLISRLQHHVNSRGLWFSLLMFSAVLVNAQTNPLLIQKIDDALKARCLDDDQTSVSVVAMPSGKVIYASNTSQPLLPASVMKIITTAAALHHLSPEYRFKTQFLHNGTRKNGVIQGDLIIRGGGDPRLSTEQFWYVANQIKASGINEITGNLVVDTHFFDQYDRAPEWEIERTQRAYDAKLGVLSLNFNTIAIHVQPGSQVGDRLNAWLDPMPAYIDLHNTSRTIKRGRSTIWAHRNENIPGQLQMQIGGKLPIGVQEKIIRLNIDNPTRYAAETFRALLQQVGVKINGEIKTVSTSLAGNELYTHLSEPLSLILKELNTYSNNFTAEQIIKTIAAERFGTPGSHAEGLRLVKDFLRIIGANLQNVILADGSGLSRKNRLTTQIMTDLLTAMYSRFDIGPDFIAALRVMGADGVLSKRLSNSPARGKIRAKTGTLIKVSTLAGYVESKNKTVFAYALFLNNNRCGHWRADKVEDSIVTAIYEFGGRGGFEYSSTAQR